MSGGSRGAGRVAGVDEVGRGCLSGPVVAAAVVIPAGVDIPGLADSKAIAAPRREALAREILARCAVGIGEADVAEIDRLNILRATFLAMRRAVGRLSAPPALVRVDGNRAPPGLGIPCECVVGGDASVAEISAASIVAKVHRDALMASLALGHPGYGWDVNAGYGTPSHKAAIRDLGPTPHHRSTFAGVKEWIPQAQGALPL